MSIVAWENMSTFCDATTGFSAEWHLRNKYRNPYRWCITTQIWVALLTGWSTLNFPCGATNKKHYLDLGSDSTPLWNFFAPHADVITRGDQRWLQEMLANNFLNQHRTWVTTSRNIFVFTASSTQCSKRFILWLSTHPSLFVNANFSKFLGFNRELRTMRTTSK